MRYRGNNSSSNNPNLMYQDECDRRMRSGTGVNKGGRSNNNFSRDGRSGGSNRDERMSSYRDRSRDGRNNYNSGPSYNNGGGEQFQSYGGGGGGEQYGSRVAPSHPTGGAAGQDQPGPPQGLFGAPPLNPPQPGPGSGPGPQPLMSQQFPPPPQPMMGFMGPGPYPFGSPPPLPPPPRK